VFEARHPRGHGEPGAGFGGHLFQGQPAPVANLDGVGAAAAREQAQDVALEKGCVHAEFQGQGAPDAPAEAVDELTQEGDGLLGIVDVPRPILEAQDVPGLRQVGHEGVVAQGLAMMGIEAAEGPLHGGARTHDSAVDIHGQARQAEFRDRLDDQLVVELNHRREGGLRELAQPVAHGMGGGDAGQAAEARDQRVAGDIAQVLEAPRADVEQRHHQQRQAPPAVVTRHAGHRAPQPRHDVEPVQVATDQLQAAVRRQLLGHELDRQITLDHSSQAPYAQAHQRGLLESWNDMGMSILSIRWKAPLIQADCRFLPPGISDQG
jgi:hypothetical protein